MCSFVNNDIKERLKMSAENKNRTGLAIGIHWERELALPLIILLWELQSGLFLE
jgi:hypothetical protein